MKHKCDGCRYKSEHQEMGFASMGVCTRTTDLVKASQNYRAEKCPYKKTNFERIKEMSVEELAPLRIQYRDDWGDYVTDNETYDEYDEALKAEIEWLESEVEH